MQPTTELSKTFASLPRTTRGQPIVIGGDPKGKNFLYTNNKGVIIRNIEDPSVSDLYTEHSVECSVAQYSPSGFYICSGDKSGKVRIWDTVNIEHILKAEYQPLSGNICDIAWTSDSQRIAVAGAGRENFAKCFVMDGGNIAGDLSKTSKACNSVSIKSTRPFRAVVGSEDQSCAFFENVPFKFKSTSTHHSNFVNAVRFSPNGELFVSGGADGRIFKYDGLTGEKNGEIGEPAHKGGIYAVCFSPDGLELLTCSGDKTCKIFNVESGQLQVTFEMGKALPDMQVGCLWQGNHLLSVSLSGYINYLDRNNPTEPLRIIKGHNKPISALAICDDYIYTADTGLFCYWDAKTGNNDEFKGKGQNSKIMDMTISGGELISVSMEDDIMFSSIADKQFGEKIKLDSQPRSVASVEGLTIIACINHVIVFENHKKLFAQAVNYEPLSVAIQQGSKLVAIGGEKDSKVHICSVASGGLTEIQVVEKSTSVACDLSFSPDGQYLVVAGGDRYVRLFKTSNFEMVLEYCNHTGKVFSTAWSPDSALFATGSLDQSIIVWRPEKATSKKKTFFQINEAHKNSQVYRVAWLNNNTIVSVGQDSHVKQWKVNV